MSDERELIVETFYNIGESSGSPIRVRPVAGQGVSTHLRVQCSRSMRCKYQVGTRFVLRLKESRRGGSVFLHAHHDAPFRVATVEDMERLLGPQLDDEAALEGVTTATEGEARIRWSTRYERSAELRAAAIRTHGLRCMGCGFSFPEVYGELGAGFIEVHHLKPVSSRGRANVDVRTEMVVLCANCHAMVHRRKGRPLVIEELRRALEQQRRGAGQA